MDAPIEQPAESDRRLLARIAHDLAQPLNAILAAVQLLRVSNDRAAVDRAAQVIDRQTQYLQTFVHRLLDDARRHHDRQAVQHFVPVDVCGLVRQVIDANRILCVQCGLTVAGELPDEPVRVDSDPVSLQEIVWNLFANAVRYTPSGGKIVVRVSEDDEQVVVAVCDTGIGLEPHEIRTIFRAFSQGECGSPLGVGLGLAIAWDLARSLGGTIDVLSLGRSRGSEFRLSLPRR